MIGVAAGLGDHVDGSALGAAVLSGKPLRADLEFLDSLQGKLHHCAADRVVFVIDAVDGGVDIAPVRAVNRNNRVTVLGRIVRVSRFRAGSKIRQIGRIAADKRQLGDLTGRYVLTHAGFCKIHDWSCTRHFHNFSGGPRAESHVDSRRLLYQQLCSFNDGRETLFCNLNLVGSGLHEIEPVGSCAVGHRGPREPGRFERGDDLCVHHYSL